MKQTILTLLVACCLALSCSHSGDVITADSISLDRSCMMLGEGVSSTLQASSKPQIKGASFEWISENPEIASVSSDGVVKGEAVGETVIRATLDGKSASCQVSVCAIPDAVNLGTGARWAIFNIGAADETEAGLPFRWASIVPVGMSDTTPYIQGISQNGGLQRFVTKYCQNGESGLNGYTDLLSTLEAQDDAATQILGAGWRTPTRSEYTQLFSACNWTWVADKNAFKIANKLPPYDYIYLPITGHPNPAMNQTKGYYWTCNVEYNYPLGAYFYEIAHVSNVITSDLHSIANADRGATYYIRAIREY